MQVFVGKGICVFAYLPEIDVIGKISNLTGNVQQDVIKHGFKLSEVKPIIEAASEQWMKNKQSKIIAIHTHKDRSSSKKYIPVSWYFAPCGVTPGRLEFDSCL